MLSRIVIFIIRLYKWMRPLKKSGRCIYRPTCSAYTIEAIQTHGLYDGCILAFERFKRCNEYEESRYDPVPLIITRSSKRKRKEKSHGKV